MTAPISPVRHVNIPELATQSQGKGPGGFGSVLESAIGQVEGSRSAAAESVQDLLTGRNEELHTTMLAVERAELSFDLMVQVRNKVVQAYQEVMHLQI